MNKKERPKVLFLHQTWKGFEKKDYSILKKNFSTEEVIIYKDFFIKTFSAFAKIKKADIIFCWFAYRAALGVLLLAKILRRKIIIVVGGWEAANLPEISFGAMRSGLTLLPTRLLTRLIVFLADRIVAVSDYNKREIQSNLRIPEEKIDLIYNAVSTKINTTSFNYIKDEDVVLTVGTLNKENLKRKGFEIFIKVAKFLPDKKFILAGKIEKKALRDIKAYLSPNVVLTDFIEDAALEDLYRRAKVYVQVSLHENFGHSLAEAMLRECVPVTTKETALPEVVGNTGYYVAYGDIPKTAEAIRLASKDHFKGGLARERVRELFPENNREKAIVDLIRKLSR